jgi:hypothetical protein
MTAFVGKERSGEKRNAPPYMGMGNLLVLDYSSLAG